MCLIRGAFVGEKNSDVMKMHDTTIKINYMCIQTHGKLSERPKSVNTAANHSYPMSTRHSKKALVFILNYMI